MAGAYLGIWFDQSVPPASMMKMATKYASELLRRDPEDQYAINMLIRASMLDNENGNGYLETINWIRKAVKKDPSNINLLNHFVQRIAYTDGDTLESVHKIAEMIPELLVTQIILAENNFKNPDEKIKYYVNLAIKFPKNKDKYDQIINSINKKENYFFNVIDFSLDTVPEYLL